MTVSNDKNHCACAIDKVAQNSLTPTDRNGSIGSGIIHARRVASAPTRLMAASSQSFHRAWLLHRLGAGWSRQRHSEGPGAWNRATQHCRSTGNWESKLQRPTSGRHGGGRGDCRPGTLMPLARMLAKTEQANGALLVNVQRWTSSLALWFGWRVLLFVQCLVGQLRSFGYAKLLRPDLQRSVTEDFASWLISKARLP